LTLHLVGVGMLFTTVFAGVVLHLQYRRADLWPERLLHLKSLRMVGLLSPLGTAIMVLTGIGNMTLGPHRYTLVSDSWLSVKLLLFAVMVLLGVLFAVLGSRRAKLAALLAAEPAKAGGETRLRAMDGRLLAALIIQGVLLVAIIALSIARPGV
jgi:uncharacterized membrane protein SirB2